ncbi:MAG: hypothetical protein HYR90_04730 [Candidatus Andersenbacteria bacterium]|nr:hypothetical protein [Candidatus Andersenbacteria bacterium]MBI3250424.1 hypothetical protein [Candidatus Andersenbacteria bacterium]
MDLTKVWITLQQHRQEIGSIMAGLCLFLAGILIGRTTSPYATAQPIIFQDRQCTDCASSGGSLTELQALQAEGVALKEPSRITTPAVAGAQQGQFVASVNSNLYHHVTCSTAARINEENKVWFASSREAEEAGYEPSACAKEKIGE